MTPHKREAEATHENQSPKRSKSDVTGVSSKSEEAVSADASKVTCIEADASEDKGCRQRMEDAWVLLPHSSLENSENLRCAHFAIYDGHGGRLAAEFAQKNLHANVLAAGLPRELMDLKAAKKAILEGFRRTDEIILQESERGNWQDGATAVCVWVLGQTVVVANIGDAKAVLARSSTTTEGETTLKSIVLTREHKAIFPQERTRIQKAGGTVGPNGRLQGRLEVSRAFGDRQFKKVFGPSDAVEFVQKQLKETSSATTAVRRLVREAIRERRCKDNCTAIVIVFKH
ncbi:protein phosphatase 2C family protein isoform X2 [Carex rostrata]